MIFMEAWYAGGGHCYKELMMHTITGADGNQKFTLNIYI